MTYGNSGSSKPSPERKALDQGQEVLGLVLGQRLQRLDRQEIVTFDEIVKRLAERNGVGMKP